MGHTQICLGPFSRAFLTAALAIAGASIPTAAHAQLGPINLAQGKTARQSSTLFGAVAGRAVDGNANASLSGNSMSHTDFDVNAWWEVDLGQTRQIGRIEIVNRIDCCAERLVPFAVIVADIPIIQSDITDADAAMYPGIMRTTITGQIQTNYYVPVNRSGRYVRIALLGQNYLHLAEVRVLEADSAARRRVATQSSTRAGGDAAQAVDGNVSGVFLNNSVASTNVETRPWWQVDLGGQYDLRQIDVWSSGLDCCMTSVPTPGYWVWVSAVPITADPVTTPIPGIQGVFVTTHGAPRSTMLTGLRGRYVRIELNGVDALSIAEVHIWPVQRGAVGGHGKLSSTADFQPASSAIDFDIGRAAATQSQVEPYLDIDLGGVRYLESARLWSQNSNTVMSTYHLFVSDTDFKSGGVPVTTVAGTQALPGVSSYVGRGTGTSSTTAVMRKGRFVRVMLPGPGASTLTVGELEIATTEGYFGAPRNGVIVGGSPPSQFFNVVGYFPRPNTQIAIYAFRPNAGAGGGSYVFVGNTTSDSQNATLLGMAAAPMYAFSASGLMMPTDTFPTGGVGGLYAEALDNDGFSRTPLRSIDEGATVTENVFWPDTRMVSSAVTPDDSATKPPYLASPAGLESWRDYYSLAGDRLPASWTSFKNRYNLSSLPGVDRVGTAEPATVVSFYNRGELGLGRRVTCRRGHLPWKPNDPRNGTWCAVEEFARIGANGKPIFGDEAGALDALVNSFPFSVSVIVSFDQVSPSGNGNETWFGAYKCTDATNCALNTQSPLDSTEHSRRVPNNCMACHGGSGALFSLARNFLLPLDVSTFGFSTARTDLSYASQAEAFRKVNALTLTDDPSASIVDFVTGSYDGGVNIAGTAFRSNYVPSGWQTTPGRKKVYEQVIKPYCRTCHQSQLSSSGGLELVDPAQAEGLRSLILFDVCVSHRMPHAQQTLKQFWRSGARAQLLGFIGRHDFDGELCKP